MGGGTPFSLPSCAFLLGLSPRGRGNRRTVRLHPDRRRTIPAWAGEPRRPGRSRRHGRDYPRVGGGTSGTPYGLCPSGGLSPRGRGNPTGATAAAFKTRTIPAWAGEPSVAASVGTVREDYPRVGGGTQETDVLEQYDTGLSPRGRGNPSPSVVTSMDAGTIPAWAGEPGVGISMLAVSSDYPRVGGGTGPTQAVESPPTGLSPRGRGNRPATPLSS